jgi:hypothetical protein
MQVKVDFEVQGGGEADVESKMSNLGVSSSPENQQFVSSLQTGLKEAAEKDEGGLLSSVASKVESEGVTVQSVEPPKKEVRLRIKEGTEPEPKEKPEGSNALIIFGIVLGICIFCGLVGVAIFAFRHPERFGCAKKEGGRGHIAGAYSTEKAKEVRAKDRGQNIVEESSKEKPASGEQVSDPVAAAEDALSPSALELAVHPDDQDGNPTVQPPTRRLEDEVVTDTACCANDFCNPSSSSTDTPPPINLRQQAATPSSASDPQVQHSFSEPELDEAIGNHLSGRYGKRKSRESITNAPSTMM